MVYEFMEKTINKKFLTVPLFFAAVVNSVYIDSAHALGKTYSLGSLAGDQNNYASSTWPSLSADGRYSVFTAPGNYVNHVFRYDHRAKTVQEILPSADNNSVVPEISANGRYIAFRSAASNLIAGDANGSISDIFVYDTQTGKVELISKSSSGVQGNNLSHFAAISADGNVIAFSSEASNLVSNDTNGYADVFVRNRKTGKTVRASVSSAGVQADSGIGSNGIVDISADGRYVAFSSSAENLVANDTKSIRDVFLRDVQSGKTTLISIPVATNGYDGGSKDPSISANGRFIAFQSGSTKLIANDTADLVSDIFVYDNVNKTARKLTKNANGNSILPAISGDGRYVAFLSQASNLVANDTNGAWDSFIYDLNTAKIARVNVTPSNGQSIGDTMLYQNRPDLSADGRFIGFESKADDLSSADTDSAMSDAFLRDTLLNSAKSADVGIQLIAPTSSLLGQQYSYNVKVTNMGPETAAQTTVIMQVPAQLTTVAIQASQGSCVKGVVTVCRLGAIASGTQQSVQLTVKSVGKGKIGVSASAQSVEKDAVVTNNSAIRIVTVN